MRLGFVLHGPIVGGRARGVATPARAKRWTPRPIASAMRWRTAGSASSRASVGLVRKALSVRIAGITVWRRT